MPIFHATPDTDLLKGSGTKSAGVPRGHRSMATAYVQELHNGTTSFPEGPRRWRTGRAATTPGLLERRLVAAASGLEAARQRSAQASRWCDACRCWPGRAG